MTVEPNFRFKNERVLRKHKNSSTIISMSTGTLSPDANVGKSGLSLKPIKLVPEQFKVKVRKELAEVAKNGLMTVLELAEKALGGVPVPGLKGAIGGILQVVKTVDVG